jgi:hypothetical protein
VTTPIKTQDYSPTFTDFSTKQDYQALSPLSPHDLRDKFYPDLMNQVYGSHFIWGISAPQDSYVTSYFFRSHVIRTRHLDSQRGYLELLSPMYEKASPDSLLHRAVYAVGLGCLSHVEKSTPLRCEARATYGKALKDLSIAIKDPVQSALDETLMTILLLSLCEVRTTSCWEMRDSC